MLCHRLQSPQLKHLEVCCTGRRSGGAERTVIDTLLEESIIFCQLIRWFCYIFLYFNIKQFLSLVLDNRPVSCEPFDRYTNWKRLPQFTLPKAVQRKAKHQQHLKGNASARQAANLSCATPSRSLVVKLSPMLHKHRAAKNDKAKKERCLQQTQTHRSAACEAASNL